jgi:hypothetical protein
MDKDTRQKVQEEADKLQARLDCLKELLKEKEQRFYKGQPVLVKSSLDTIWQKRYLSHINGERFFCFHENQLPIKGTTTSYWLHCKPDPSAPSLLNWIEWEGGECPVDGDRLVLTEEKCGDIEVGKASDCYWDDVNHAYHVIRYAVIEKPEFI